jgi:hypothetical protein
MTDWQRPDRAIAEAAAPLDEPGPAAGSALPAAGASAPAPAAIAEEPATVAAADDEVPVVRRGARPSPLVLLASLAAVALVAQAVMAWLSLGLLTQVRDQSAVANGLQRCLIQAQLSATSSTDTTGAAYRTAVQACLNK